MKTLKVRTKKIYSHDDFGRPNIEECIISLEEGKPFNGFVKFLNSQRYSEVPTVEKVIENGKDVSDVKPKDSTISNIEEFQSSINAVYGKKTSELKVDYKKKSEDQEGLIAKLKAQNESFEQRFKALENKDSEIKELELLKSKHIELFGKEADKRMKIENLRSKIEEKENE